MIRTSLKSSLLSSGSMKVLSAQVSWQSPIRHLFLSCLRKTSFCMFSPSDSASNASILECQSPQFLHRLFIMHCVEKAQVFLCFDGLLFNLSFQYYWSLFSSYNMSHTILNVHRCLLHVQLNKVYSGSASTMTLKVILLFVVAFFSFFFPVLACFGCFTVFLLCPRVHEYRGDCALLD